MALSAGNDLDDGVASFEAVCARVRRRYRSASRYGQGYVRWKLRLDPVHRAVLGIAAGEALGSVVDLGCGRGQLGLTLLEAGLAEAYTGLDWDARGLADARAAARGIAARFVEADLRKASVPEGDTILLIDSLYQLPAADQLDFLGRAADAAGRRLLLRTGDPDRGWRSRVGRASEAWTRLLGVYRSHRAEPMPLAQLAVILERRGFACDLTPCWAGTPLPNVLLVARRRLGKESGA